METLYTRYISNIVSYNKLENIDFKPDESDENILARLFASVSQKHIIFNEQNSIINELLSHNNDEDGLDSETYEKLKELAFNLFKYYKNLDVSVAYRIHEILLKDALKRCDYDQIAEGIYGCGITQWQLRSEHKSLIPSLAFSDIVNYSSVFDRLSDTGKSYYIRSLCNQMLDLNLERPTVLINKSHILLKRLDDIEKNYPDLKYDYNKARFSIYQNITTSIQQFRDNIETTSENTQAVLDAASICLELSVAKYGSTKNLPCLVIYRYYAALFHAGRITIDKLLEQIDKLTIPDSDLTERENFTRVFKMTAFYIEYMNLYSELDSEEKARISGSRINSVMVYASNLKKTSESLFINNYLLSFIISSFGSLSFKNTWQVLFKITIHQQPSTLIHTLMVEKLSSLLLKHIIENNPEALAGICDNYSAEYIQSHEKQLLKLVKNMALIHDIGKYRCSDIISNASRKLDDFEFSVIKEHPMDGYLILKNSDADQAIKDGVLYHHRWHNGKGGYPLGLPDTNNQPLIDILSIADSLDAATDFFGRSYNNPKKLSELIDEFNQTRDTRYGGFVIDALCSPDVHQQAEHILNEERKRIICNVYRKRALKTEF